MDFSSWYVGKMRQSLLTENGCPTCGHSISEFERFCFLAWMGGAIYLHDEGGSLSYYLNKQPNADGILQLSTVGIAAQRFADFASKNSRGYPFVPVAILVNRYHGISRLWSTGVTWDYLPFTQGDAATYNLFNQVVWPSAFNDTTGSLSSEVQDIVNTPFGFGDVFDVLTEDASLDILKKYKILILTGDIDFNPSFTNTIAQFLAGGGRVILNLNLTSSASLWSNSQNNIYIPGSYPVLAQHLKLAYDAVAPFSVSGNVSYQISQFGQSSWQVAVYNNSGVTKSASSSVEATIDHSFDQNIAITVDETKNKLTNAQLLKGTSQIKISGNQLQMLSPAGEVIILLLQIASTNVL